jgi:hypothetical protein
MLRTIITAAALATASLAFVPASHAEDLGAAASNATAQPEAYRGYGYSRSYGYGYSRPSYSYGYSRPSYSYGYSRPSYSYGYASPSYGYGYSYGGYRSW